MRKDLICGSLALALALVYLVETSKIQVSALGDTVGSGGFPLILGWMLAGTACLLLVQAVLRRNDVLVAEPNPGVGEGGAPAGGGDVDVSPGLLFRRAAGLALIAAAFILLLNLLGYVPSVALMLASVIAYQGFPLDRRTILVSALGALLLYGLFRLLLGIPLPVGLVARLFG